MTICVNNNEYSSKFECSFDCWLRRRQTRSFREYCVSISRISSSLCDLKTVFRFDDERARFAKNSSSKTVQFVNKKENQRFSSNSDMFSRNCHISYVTDLLNELVYLFFVVWRKEWKKLSFSKINDKWFDFLTNFFFLIFVIFWSFFLFDFRTLCIFKNIIFFFVFLFFQVIVKSF